MQDEGRNTVIDFWRGFALLTIFVNHVPGLFLGAYTYRNFGVSDAAELFVLLAGVSAAFAYLKPYAPGARLRTIARILMRAFHLYAAHLALVLVAVAVVGGFVVLTGDTRVLDWYHLDVLAALPVEALVGVALLTFQPAYLNILPLYVVLLLTLPLLVPLMRRSLLLGLGAAAALYLAAQLFPLAPPVWPNDGRWQFNPFAWLLLFACGLAVGVMMQAHRRIASRALDILAPIYLFACALWAMAGYPFTLDLSPVPAFVWDFDKANLTLPRLLHVLALAYCVSRLRLADRLAMSVPARPLVLMGRQALAVFCVGTVLSLAAQVTRPAFDGAISFDLLIITAGFLIQWLLAWALEWQRTGRRTASAPAQAA